METVVREPRTTQLYTVAGASPSRLAQTQSFPLSLGGGWEAPWEGPATPRQPDYRPPLRYQPPARSLSQPHGPAHLWAAESQPRHHQPPELPIDQAVPDHTYFFPPAAGPAAFPGQRRLSWVDWCLEHFCCCLLEDLPLHRYQEAGIGGGGGPMPFRGQQRHPGGGAGRRGLSEDVYEKIREVDAQSSTLTAAGARGLSARILDRIEYHEYLPDGSPETFVCQTVELVKRPGQSLGLFLREGNSIERQDGVFVSRLADGSELHHHPDVLRPMDEVLTVNNVDVRHMSIDEVVVIMSIPRRLILRIRFIKSRREIHGDYPSTSAGLGGGLGTGGQGEARPVVVVKDGALRREDSKESAFTDDNGGPGPTPTAQTSLGIKARQQLEEIQRATGLGPGAGGPQPFGNLAGQATLPRQRLAQPPHSQGLAPRQHFALHTPRLLDSEGQPMVRVSSGSELGQMGRPLAHPGGSMTPGPLRRAVDPLTGAPLAPMAGPFSARGESLADYQSSFAQPPPVPPKPVLRQPSAFPAHALSSPSAALFGPHYPPDAFAYKSNSLPRGMGQRRGGPRVKWKNDVEGGRGTPLSLLPPHLAHGAHQAQLAHDAHMAHSDSEAGGGFSAPEFSPSQPPLPPHSLAGLAHPALRGMPPFSQSNQPFSQPSQPFPPPAPLWQPGPGHSQAPRNIEEIFSAADYQAWSDEAARGRMLANSAAKLRSSSLPPRSVLNDLVNLGQPGQRFSIPPATSLAGPSGGGYPYSCQPSTSSGAPLYSSLAYPSQQTQGLTGDRETYARLDVSPLLHRRGPAPLRPVGSGWNADEAQPSTSQAHPHTSQPGQSGPQAKFPLGPSQVSTAQPNGGEAMPYHSGLLTAMTGLLVVHILEGRGLKVPERHKDLTEEIYCVLEVDGEHRARTGVSTLASHFTWNETFEMEVEDARQMDIYVYSWHPQLRHKLCHRGSLKLMEAFVIDKLNGERRFALTLEPRGQLLIRINFLPLSVVFRRSLALRRSAYFGVELGGIVEREKSGLEVPIGLKRLLEEIERRGLDSPGLYMIAGAAEKKRELRYRLERSPAGADLSPDTQPDTNVLTSVVRDFLRELPEPPFPPCVFQMLMEGLKVCLPNDSEGNARLMLGVVDCVPRVEKCLVLLVMDHLAALVSQSPHNGMSWAKVGGVFGPLLFSSAQPRLQIPPEIAAAASAAGIARRSAKIMSLASLRPGDFLDVRLAAQVLTALLQLWPGRTSSTDSSGSENSTLSLTNNGALPLVDVWMAEHRLPESDC